MAWFTAFRQRGWNTYYPSRERSPVLFDVTQIVLLFFIAVFIASALIDFVGSKGKKRWVTLLRFFFSLQTGAVIIVCVTSQCWLESAIRSRCHYSVQSGESEMMADIGVWVGLKSVNVTLTGSFRSGSVKYNEKFSFDGLHDMKREYYSAMQRGLPEAILQVVEYLTIDSGGLRWNRALRESGHVCYLLLWSSLAVWVFANLTLCVSVVRGAALVVLTGCMLIGSVVLYHALQPSFVVAIPFEDGFITLHYGWCFWLVACSGGVTVMIGLVVFLSRCWAPRLVDSLLLLDHHRPKVTEPVDCMSAACLAPLQLEPNRVRLERLSTEEDIAKCGRDNVAFVTDDTDADDKTTTRTRRRLADDSVGSSSLRRRGQEKSDRVVVDTSNPKSAADVHA